MKKYFLIRYLGYDGLMTTAYDSLSRASAAYKEDLREQRVWDEKYPNDPSDKGLVVIRGEVVISDHEENILG